MRHEREGTATLVIDTNNQSLFLYSCFLSSAHLTDADQGLYIVHAYLCRYFKI